MSVQSVHGFQGEMSVAGEQLWTSGFTLPMSIQIGAQSVRWLPRKLQPKMREAGCE
jgi:hypothetical protein